MNDVDRSRDYDRDAFRSDDPDLEAYEYENEDGGVRMPLFLILALVVIAAIVGVWFVAYQQGLNDGRAETPRFIPGDDTAQRTLPDSPGGLPAPRDSDVFGGSTDQNTDLPGRVVPREEQIVDLPAPPQRGIEQVQVPSTQPGLRGAGAPAEVDTQPLNNQPFQTSQSRVPLPSGSTIPQPSSGPATVPAPSAQPTTTPGSVPPPSTSLRQPGPSTVPQPSTTTTTRVPLPSATANSAPANRGAIGPQPAATGSATGNFVVQLASLPSANAADQTWTRIQSRMTDVLSGYQKDVQVADLGARGVFYRLRIGYFPDRATASNLCQTLKSRGQDCLVASR